MTGRFPRQFGKYVLLKPLAKGGMGEIYLAAGGDVGGFEKLCVIKKVITEKADRNKANRFLDEAKVVLRLSHSALVNTFDAGEVNGEFYIAMELVEGKDLREVWNRCVRTRQRIPLDVALHVVREVARALAYVHGYGDLKLVHRDVAPPNILLAYVGDVKLTDFGLARSVLKQEHTAPGVVFGRAAYLAPEQARGEVADARTDVYTLGIVLWELLTGQQFLQLAGLDPAAALAMVRNPRSVAPSTRAPWITPALDQVALRALAPDREKRFQSAEELRQALTTVIAEIAPTADSSRVSEFLGSIYEETIAEERSEREQFLKEEIPTFRSALAKGVRFPSDGDVAEAPAPVPLPGVPPVIGPGEDAEALVSRLRVRRPSPPRLPGMPVVEAPAARASEGVGAPAFLSAFRADARPRAANGSGSDDEGIEPPAGENAPRVGGRYRLGRVLCESPGGPLHAATDEKSGLEVTVHLLPRNGEAAALEGWKKICRAVSAIRHPHLAELLDFGLHDSGGRPYAVYEKLTGGDLLTLLARGQRLEPGTAIRIGLDVAEALTACHAGGVFHGSLRPAVVFLSGRPQTTKVLGFGGLSRLASEDHPGFAARLPTGIVEYLSPQQIEGQTPDARSDLYGLGATLYEMVTGVPPYAGPRELVERKKQTPPQSPRLFRPDLPAELDQLILTLLEPDAARRPALAADVVKQLEALLKAAGPTELAVASQSDEERRRSRRDAAFRAIAELAGEATAGPQLLEAAMAGAGGAVLKPVEAARPSKAPPPPPPAAFAVAGAPAPESAAPQPLARPGGLPPAVPMLGGAVLARYGVGPETEAPGAQKRLVRVAVIVVAAAAAVVLLVKLIAS